MSTATLFHFTAKYTGPVMKIWGDNIPLMAQEPRPSYPRTGYFKSQASLKSFLNKWTTSGWEYFTTAEDDAFNASSKQIIVKGAGAGFDGTPCWCEGMHVRVVPV